MAEKELLLTGKFMIFTNVCWPNLRSNILLIDELINQIIANEIQYLMKRKKRHIPIHYATTKQQKNLVISIFFIFQYTVFHLMLSNPSLRYDDSTFRMYVRKIDGEVIQ